MDDEALDNDPSYADLLEHVRHLRNGLPQAMRSLVTLRYEKDLSIGELSKLTGMSIMTVKRKLREAKQILKERLEEQI